MARLISRYAETAFVCKKNHVSKKWCWQTTTEITCPACGGVATPLYAQRSDNAQRFDPVLVARNPRTGEIRHLASGKARVPHGFERAELRTRAEIDAACRQLDRQDERAHDDKVSREQRGREMYADPLRGYIPQTAQGRAMMEYAERQYQHSYTPRFQSGNHVEAFEYDRGNRD